MTLIWRHCNEIHWCDIVMFISESNLILPYPIQTSRCNWLWWFGNPPAQSTVDSHYEWPVIPSFNALIIACQNKLTKKHLNFQWFEAPWRSCDVTVMWYIDARSVCLSCWSSRETLHYFIYLYRIYVLLDVLLAGLYLFLPANLSHPTHCFPSKCTQSLRYILETGALGERSWWVQLTYTAKYTRCKPNGPSFNYHHPYIAFWDV